MIQQVSVFLDNKEGRLHDVLHLLSKNKIDIRALTIAETSDYSVLRMILNDPVKATRLLKQHDFRVNETNVITVEVDDTYGSVYQLIELLAEHQIYIEYAYTGTALTDGNALFVVRIRDNRYEEAVALLESARFVNFLEKPVR